MTSLLSGMVSARLRRRRHEQHVSAPDFFAHHAWLETLRAPVNTELMRAHASLAVGKRTALIVTLY